MHAPRLLGISASLRNPWPLGSQSFITQDILALGDEPDLMDYIRTQGDYCLDKYLEAGRKDGLKFDRIYDNLSSGFKPRGLANSELALVAALWSAGRLGAEIRHVPLSAHFPPQGGVKAPELLEANLLWADGVIISGPVYFGDRSSLVKALQDFIMAEPRLRQALRGKLYGGLSVGAKRNGGQETTLIYQLLDMLDGGMLGVGNDSDTTAQYGGTGHAGDVGTLSRDAYGLETSMGVGRRMAKVARLLSPASRLKANPQALVMLLQDAGEAGARAIEELRAGLASVVDLHVVDFTASPLRRCMACDICPARVDVDESYGCLVKNDAMSKLHGRLLDHDLLIPVVVSPRDPTEIRGDYQIVMERTRYIRRGDYKWSDALVAPVVIQEAGGVSTYPLRMLTSFIRHHTVMFRPLVSHLVKGQALDLTAVLQGLVEAAGHASRLGAGRLAGVGTGDSVGYNPVGYVLSADKGREDRMLQKRKQIVLERERRLGRLAAERLRP